MSMIDERRAGVEAVPAEPQDQTADDGDREIVRQHRAAAVALELATQPRPKQMRAGDGDPAADRVHDGRAGEVVEVHAEARQEVAFAAHRGEEAVRTPAPVAEDRIDEAGDADRSRGRRR